MNETILSTFHRKIFLLAGLLGLGLWSPLHGATFYVNGSTGNDANPGTQASPVKTIQRGINLADAAINSNVDAVVHVVAGSYPEVTTIGGVSNTARSLTLEGEAGTVITGADTWNTGWTQNADGTYWHAWPYKWGPQAVPNGWDGYWNWDGKGYIRDRLLRSEMVYIDNKPLLGRLNASELSTAGTFYVDETNSKITMRPYSGTNLATSKIEVAIRGTALSVLGRYNLTIKNLIFEKGRGSVQTVGANQLEFNHSHNVTLDGVTIRLGASGGLGNNANTNVTMRNCKFIDNGVYALYQSNVVTMVLEDSEIARNNWRGWDAEHKGFATNVKFFGSRGLTVQRVQFIDNSSHGMWLDSDNKNVLVDQVFSARNKLNGFYNEMNQGPNTIQNSKFCENGVSGISSASGSSNFNVLNNQVFNNLISQIAYTGQNTPFSIPQWDSTQTVYLNTTNHTIQGNTFTGYGNPQYAQSPPEGWMHWEPWQGQLPGWLSTYKGDNNRYYHRDSTVVFGAGRKDLADALVRMDFNTWRTNYANDPSNVNKNNEANSVWADTPNLSCTPGFVTSAGAVGLTGPIGPQASITCPAGAINIAPGANIQTAVNNNPNNTTFCIKAGVHNITYNTVPKSGDSFIGEYGAILDGSSWVTTDRYSAAAFYAHNMDIDDVTIKNLVIRRMPGKGISAYYWMSDRWTIDHNEIAYNYIVGVAPPHNSVVSNNFIHHNVGDPNSQISNENGGGYMVYMSSNVLIVNNDISYNGPEQKVMGGGNVTFRSNYLHHNMAAGVWFDGGQPGSLVEDNLVEDNMYFGIEYELSVGGIARNNIVRRSGWQGIAFNTSKGFEIYNNTLEDNGRGIGLGPDCLRLHEGDLSDNFIHDNVIKVGTFYGPNAWPPYANGIRPFQCTSTQAAPYLNGSKNNRFVNNHYFVLDLAGSHWDWGDTRITWSAWQGYGNDTTGSIALSSSYVPSNNSACDINRDGMPNGTDVQLCADQAVGATPCTNADVNRDGTCNVIDVQQVVNAALGGLCVSPATTARGPQPTITCPAGSINIFPGTNNIQAAVNANPNGTTFCLKAGVFSVTSDIRPKTGNTFVGEYGAILDGTGWAYRDGEQAAFRAHNEDIDDVTIKNLVIRNMPSVAIHAFRWMSDRWTIENNELAYGKYGVSLPPGAIVRNNYIHHNISNTPNSPDPAERGGAYIAAKADNILFDNNEFAYNGAESKVALTVGTVFVNNYFHHNVNGIWYDSEATQSRIENNRLEDNTGYAIFYEASGSAVIKNNTVRRSGVQGIIISTSHDVEISGNLLEDNYREIDLYFNGSVEGAAVPWCNNIGEPCYFRNVNVHDNTIRVGTRADSLATGISYSDSTSAQIASLTDGSRNITFTNNTYTAPNTTTRWWMWAGATLDWTGWRSKGFDLTGSFGVNP